jgi:dCTP deaminase
MLSDGTLRELVQSGQIKIDPEPADGAYQPASIDLRLGGAFVSLLGSKFTERERVYLESGECFLAHTIEHVTIPADLVARVEGKSTWGRRFVMVHSTAGFIDPGFSGQITLEIHNLSRFAQSVPVGASIAQISFQRLDKPALRPYGSPGLGSHYQGQTGATPASA